MITNTITELSVHDQFCARAVRHHYEDMESSLIKLLKAGVAHSDFRRNLDVKITAKYLITVVTGLQTLSKSPQTLNCSAKDIDKLIDVAMKSLE